MVVLLMAFLTASLRSALSYSNHIRDALVLAACAAGAAGVVTLTGIMTGDAVPGDGAGAIVVMVGAWAAVVGRIAAGAVATAFGVPERLRRRVAIYGASDVSSEILAALQARNKDIFFVGLFDDRTHKARRTEFGVTVSGTSNTLIDKVRDGSIDEVFVALPHTVSDRISDLASRIEAFPVDVHFTSEAAAQLCAPHQTYYVSALGTVELACVQRRPLRDWSLIAKGAQDRIGGTLLLALLAPLFLIIGICIKLESRGPVFFRQRRHGLCGRMITVWKFRTMRTLDDGAVVQQASKNDSRVTRVGRVLRKTSLDELPQLINVVLGEMSIVGPRPHAIAHNEYYAEIISAYNGRCQMKPGITGWAQVCGYRGETTDPSQMARRVEHDLWYIRNWSLMLDIRIIMLTPIYGLVHKNAY